MQLTDAVRQAGDVVGMATFIQVVCSGLGVSKALLVLLLIEVALLASVAKGQLFTSNLQTFRFQDSLVLELVGVDDVAVATF